MKDVFEFLIPTAFLFYIMYQHNASKKAGTCTDWGKPNFNKQLNNLAVNHSFRYSLS